MQQKSNSIVSLNIGGTSPQHGVQSLQQSLCAVTANQHGLINDFAGNSLSLAAICGNPVLMATANYCIMAPFTATQQQDIRRKLAHAAGVDGYLQSRCNGLAAYLTTWACHSQPLLKNPKAQDLNCNTGSPLLKNFEA